jgi:hypothetical protein
MAKYCEEVVFLAIRYSAAAMKSSNTFCFGSGIAIFSRIRHHHVSWVQHKRSFSIHGIGYAKLGVKLTLNPPYP